ncbi:integrase, partial [Pseudomonas helleri]|uniref:integrase n=1 Tax=Pseudomonas helleri TaxID=1608996 RepID=UPI003FD4CCB6
MSAGYVSGLFISSDKSDSVAPDSLGNSTVAPSADFVLCRDKNGKPTATYGDDVWDFNPYRLSAKKIMALNFNSIFAEGGPEQEALIAEVKYILFCLIYSAGSGRVGRLSPSTLLQYFVEFRIAARFCFDQKNKPLVGVLSMRQLLITPVYFAVFVSQNNKRTNFNRTFKGLLNHLVTIGEQRLGYKVISSSDLEFGRTKSMQHPVIPTHIYLGIINQLGGLLDQLYPGLDGIENFISCFADFFYGRSKNQQRTRGAGGEKHRRPTFDQALQSHGLSKIMSDEFACSDRRQLSRSLMAMQCVVKTIIHLYTGMRDQEVLRLSYNCLSQEVAVSETVDDHGSVRDSARMISIISTTTKFEGYRKEESWLATEEVIKAIKVAQAICRGLCVLYGIDNPEKCSLFLNSAILLHEDTEVGVGRLDKRAREMNWSRGILIQSADLRELTLSDPERDYYSDNRYALGKPWPLSSHQLRRSLAFYASSSGFVSLPSLKSQYKHMTIQMTRYYANNFENLKTIFGYFDVKKNEFVLPASHVALEFQVGMPMAVANQLLADLLGKETSLFGGTGSYMEKQKARVESGELCVEDIRAETLSRVKNGELYYRSTLLGGCTKVGRCDSFLLGDFVECLSCEGAIIKSEKIDDAIVTMNSEIATYEKNSVEYQITKIDLDKLVSFQARVIET